MHCPYCEHGETKVVDTRVAGEGAIRRRRECMLCGQRMTTYEGFDANLRPVDLTPDQLLVSLVEGWQYLLKRDPSVLRWVVEHQRNDQQSGG